MKMFGGQVIVSVELKVNSTSAMCTQLAPAATWNVRPSAGTLSTWHDPVHTRHTLTRESQEVVVALLSTLNPSDEEDNTILFTPIPHYGQLNITMLTLSSLVR